MSLAVVHTRARLGIRAPSVQTEVHLSNGLPALNIVGLPETAVRESKDRVRSALLNVGFTFPARRITVNLAPADLPKEGGRFDLPIALGILLASGQLPPDALVDYECLGELALSGAIRPVPGILSAVVAATAEKRRVLVPADSLPESMLCSRATVFGPETLAQATAHLNQSQLLEARPAIAAEVSATAPGHDMSVVQGHFHARRALEIAATGGHGLLFSGPPGTGKTLLAQCLPGILPELDEHEALEVASIYSLCGQRMPPWRQPPWRAPHHTASSTSLTGGGSHPRPGEISLAHHGVLFLDELPEFDRRTLEILRQPLELGEVCISRAKHQVTFPARFQLLAAMNPCPCGFLGSRDQPCRCSPDQIQRYQRRLSGPLLDRIDMKVTMDRLPPALLLQTSQQPPESSARVRPRVCSIRSRIDQRQGCMNAHLEAARLLKICQIGSAEKKLLEKMAHSLKLSGRGLHRMLRVARTLADMAHSEHIVEEHLMEAASYRPAWQSP